MLNVRESLGNAKDDPVKYDARQKTVIEPYRLLTTRSKFRGSLPPEHYYYGLPGRMLDKPSGGVQKECELMVLIESGLISPEQYRGAEIYPEIYEANVEVLKRMHPEYPVDQMLHFGDIIDVLASDAGKSNFRPALVNLDTQFEPPRAARLLGRTLNILNRVDAVEHPIVVVWNTILRNKRKAVDKRHEWKAVKEVFGADCMMQRSLLLDGKGRSTTGWKQVRKEVVEYWRDEEGTRFTLMGTIVFVRRGEAIKDA